jgi:hypothetical protein
MIEKPTLKIIGKDGNAFAILGAALKAGREAGWSVDRMREFSDKAQSGDYDNLLRVCAEFFEVE